MNIAFFAGSTCTNEYNNEIYQILSDKFKSNVNIDCIITGGTIGIMEAISKASFENNIYTIGISNSKWEEYVNKYNSNYELYDDELERTKQMLSRADIYICLDGGIGTLSELFLALELCINFNKKMYVCDEKIQKLILYVSENIDKIEIGQKIIFKKLEEINFGGGV
jgi:predicted Rossmann-fold nucleotide-binding protein